MLSWRLIPTSMVLAVVLGCGGRAPSRAPRSVDGPGSKSPWQPDLLGVHELVFP